LLIVGEVLDGCPAGEHFGWWLNAWRRGSNVAPSELARHLEVTSDRVTDADFEFGQVAAGGRAVAEVLGWRSTRFGSMVVTYRGDDGRLYDLVAEVDGVTGRLVRPRAMRSANGAEISVRPCADLSSDERAEIHDVFAEAYRDADHGWLDRRLDGLGSVGVGWRDGRIAGFVASSAAQKIELPLIGEQRVTDGGVTCIRPNAQGTGLANAIGQEMIRTRPGGDPDIVVNHYATPVTLRAMFHIGRYQWPGNNIHEAAATLATPTHSQRLVGAALAQRGGAIDYDADHWVLRGGQPAGESVTDPVDLEAEYDQLFRHIDRSRGDTLLGVFWITQPPPQWWH
jgi:hypothetical protein